jgi:hypothetical protein
MFDYIHAAVAEWGLAAAALACFAGAVAAFIYVPVVGRRIAIVLIALGSALIAYELGYQARGNLDTSGVLQAQLDEASRELAATQKVAADANATAKAAADFNAAQQEKIRAYEATLKANSQAGGCSLSDDDVRSLSNIGAGRAPLPPHRPAGLRPAGQGAGSG